MNILGLAGIIISVVLYGREYHNRNGCCYCLINTFPRPGIGG
jgi:hypothetical protein